MKETSKSVLKVKASTHKLVKELAIAEGRTVDYLIMDMYKQYIQSLQSHQK